MIMIAHCHAQILLGVVTYIHVGVCYLLSSSHITCTFPLTVIHVHALKNQILQYIVVCHNNSLSAIGASYSMYFKLTQKAGNMDFTLLSSDGLL